MKRIIFALLIFAASVAAHAQTPANSCPATQYVTQQLANTGQTCGAPSTDGSVIPTASVCRITSAITLSASATTVCSWTLAASTTYVWSCNFAYAITAGTLPTVAIGMNAAQAPMSETGYANIFTSNSAGGNVSGNATSTSAGNVNIKTGGSVTTGTYPAVTFGVVQGSATPGTFAITALLGGTTPSGTIPVGGSCTLW
jgi:hypothetical protein